MKSYVLGDLNKNYLYFQVSEKKGEMMSFEVFNPH